MNKGLNTFSIHYTLTEEEHHLLKENKGCFKCCKPFAGHLTRDSACNFPSPMDYVALTQTLTTLLKQNYQAKKHVAAIGPPQVEPLTSEVPQDNVAHPIMVLMPGISNLVAYRATNMSEHQHG